MSSYCIHKLLTLGPLVTEDDSNSIPKEKEIVLDGTGVEQCPDNLVMNPIT